MDLFVSAAEDDPHTRDENLAFHRKLVKMGVDHQWRLAPGPADWGFFRGQLAEHLAFHARALTDGDKKENDG
jgi:S-formylglutathione hydrolase FrmB